MLETPAVTRRKFRFADQAFYTASNWFFMEYCIVFSPWLITVSAAYHIAAYLGYTEYQKYEFRNREQAQTKLQQDLAHYRAQEANADPFVIREMETAVRRNDRLLEADRQFANPSRDARFRRELNDFATTAMFCMMSGNPVVIGAGTVVVIGAMVYNYMHHDKSDSMNPYQGIVAFLGAYTLACSPSVIFFATIVIAGLKFMNMYDYRHRTGSRAYGKVDQKNLENAESAGAPIDTNYNARMGRIDSIKLFNFNFTDEQHELFMESFLFENSEFNDNHAPVVNSTYHFPAKNSDTNFPDWVPQDIINNLNNALDHIFIYDHNLNNSQQPLVSTQMRIQAFRNIITQQRDILAERLADPIEVKYPGGRLDQFMEICENRLDELQLFCEKHLKSLDEQAYYTLFCLSLKHPNHIAESLRDGSLDPLDPSIKGKENVFLLPTWASTYENRFNDYWTNQYFHFAFLNHFQDLYDVFEDFHHWPNFDSWNFNRIITWLFYLERPHVQVIPKEKQGADGYNYTVNFTRVKKLASNHTLEVMAKGYIATCKALGIKKDSLKITTSSNRFRRYLRRVDEAFGNGEPFNIQFMDPKHKDQVLHFDTFSTIDEDEARADGLDIQIDENKHPIIPPHTPEEDQHYNRLIQERCAATQPQAELEDGGFHQLAYNG